MQARLQEMRGTVLYIETMDNAAVQGSNNAAWTRNKQGKALSKLQTCATEQAPQNTFTGASNLTFNFWL